MTFAESIHQVDPADADGLSFGRGAALDIDSNPFLHRLVGRFVCVDDIWWVENLNGWTPITISADGTSTLLTGDGRAALAHAESVVRFEAGVCNYEIRVSLDAIPLLPATDAAATELTATFRPTSLDLTDEQRLLVVALAELRLRSPAERFRLPTNASVARRLGWSTPKFNRKLDYLCSRLDRAGVSGLRSTGRRVNDRRLRIVDHLIATGAISDRDLELLDAYAPPGEEREGDDERW